MTRKILIMVLSYDKSPYAELLESQINTWASVKEENVQTFFYNGMNDIPDLKIPSGMRGGSGDWSYLNFPIRNDYHYMAGKFRLALDWVFGNDKTYDFDLIFRTNSSSYCQKERLKKIAETLPTKNLYAGWSYIDSEDFGGVSISGAGIWLSRDTAEILRNDIDPDKELEEDVYCGRLLRKHGIEAIDDKSRFDVGEFVNAYPPTDRYHYRLKNGDRLQDAANMKILHEKIK